jgi:TRAP-type uncharacterized transport system substrate-binding protein
MRTTTTAAAWAGVLIGLALAIAAPSGGTPAIAAAESLRLCTGAPGKAYLKIGQKLAQLAPRFTMGSLQIEVVPTAGSLDNLNRTLAGGCDAFIAQGDAIDFFTREVQPQAKDRFQVLGELYKELTLLLCRRDGGIDDLGEAKDAVIAAGNMGTGSLATLLNLQRLDPEAYGEIRIHPANGFEGAMAVVNGEAQCLLDVIAPQSDLVRVLNDDARTGTQLRFAEIDNEDLEAYAVGGKKVYTLVEFDDETYRNLAGVGDPEMLAIGAVLAMPREYAQAHPQAVSALSMLLLTGAREIAREAYGERKPFKE